MLCTIGMWILRLPYAAMIGCLVGVTALLPVIGAYIGAAAGACMLLTVSPVKAPVFLIFLTILQQIEGNFIYPRVVGHSIGLPGIWVLAAVIVGGGAFGIWGILFAKRSLSGVRPTPHAFFVWRYLCFAGVVCIIYYVLLWKRAKKNNKEKRIMNNGCVMPTASH